MQNVNTELYHHGVKNQRWGIRRYQNKDGTLTPAGRKRAAKLRNDYLQLTRTKQLRGDNHKTSSSTKTTEKTKQKSISEMSDDELRRVITRKQLEQQYAQLSPKKVSAGKNIVDKILLPAVQESSKRVLSAYMEKEFKNALSGLERQVRKQAKT